MEAKKTKEIAKILFVQMGLSQTEVASRLSKKKSQISRWVNDGNWKILRSSMVATSDKIVERTFSQITRIYDQADEDDRTLTSTESDQIAKLMAAIKDIKRGADLSAYIEAFEGFIVYLRDQDAELSQMIADYQMDYLSIKALELSKE